MLCMRCLDTLSRLQILTCLHMILDIRRSLSWSMQECRLWMSNPMQAILELILLCPMSKRNKLRIFYKAWFSSTYRSKIRGRRRKKRKLQPKMSSLKSQPRRKRSLRNLKKQRIKRRSRGSRGNWRHLRIDHQGIQDPNRPALTLLHGSRRNDKFNFRKISPNFLYFLS